MNRDAASTGGAVNHTLETISERCIEDGDCLVWQGALMGGSRPAVSIGGKVISLRRHIFTELLGKKIPRGHLVTFSCTNSRCLAEEHITTMTRTQLTKSAAERTQYAIRPERRAKLAKAAQERSPYTQNDVAMVRGFDGSARKAARVLGVSRDFATQVRANRSWAQTTPFSGLGARSQK